MAPACTTVLRRRDAVLSRSCLTANAIQETVGKVGSLVIHDKGITVFKLQRDYNNEDKFGAGPFMAVDLLVELWFVI